jgi:hypothetical protein
MYKSVKVFLINILLMYKYIIGILGSNYFGVKTLLNIRSASFPIELMVGGGGDIYSFSHVSLCRVQ